MKIGIIGFGNLGRALAEGLIKSGTESKNIYVYNRTPSVCEDAVRSYGLSACGDINYVISNSEVIFLVVKSYVYEELAKLLDASLFSGKTVVSFMAGMDMDTLAPLCGDAVLVRAMPSLSIAVCDGIIGYTFAPPEVSEILHGLGYAFEVEPCDLEKVTAFSACGLGFAAYLIDAYVKAGINLGFSSDESEKITVQTFLNALDRGNFADTVKAVATKGGATEQGVLHMDACGVRGAVSGAVKRAYDRMI